MKRLTSETFVELAETFYSIGRFSVFILLFLSLSLAFYERELKKIEIKVTQSERKV